eukprot:SAG22_NODE_2183_length_2874_cov_1.789550_3_plen_62_part_00
MICGGRQHETEPAPWSGLDIEAGGGPEAAGGGTGPGAAVMVRVNGGHGRAGAHICGAAAGP